MALGIQEKSVCTEGVQKRKHEQKVYELWEKSEKEPDPLDNYALGQIFHSPHAVLFSCPYDHVYHWTAVSLNSECQS